MSAPPRSDYSVRPGNERLKGSQAYPKQYGRTCAKPHGKTEPLDEDDLDPKVIEDGRAKINSPLC